MSAVIDHSSVQPEGMADLVVGPGTRLVAIDGRRPVSRQEFRRDVHGLAAWLPEGGPAINLCEDRYRFLVALCAASARGQTTLLPPSRTSVAIAEVVAAHPGAYCLGEAGIPRPPAGCHTLPAVLPQADGPALQVSDQALAVIGFTSGSTGAPCASPKTWGSFRASNRQNLAALQDLWLPGESPCVVATVPPQHMYGMELSVVLPLLGGAAVHGGRPLFPADVVQALQEAPGPRLLVTTPVHLRALLAAGVPLPPLAGIVSATAPLAPELAARAEERFGCEVRELFGSTETCVIARRRTARESAWTPLPGVRLRPQPDGALVEAPHLAQPVGLADLVELCGDGRFLLRGRQADLLEIAGKRASLGDLTRRLLAIPGVEDGVVFQLDPADGERVGRIAALVVAPDLGAPAILSAMRASIDPVFLPRPLRRVDALPRNATGKLPRQELLALLRAG